MDIYEKIISLDNIQNAYLDVVRTFEEQGRTRSYLGHDGKTLTDYDLDSQKLCLQIQREISQLKTIRPARELLIPKRFKEGKRRVFVHTIIERVKAQAVYRVISTKINNYFSHYLYSYRPSHPHYQALRTAVRAYKKKHNTHVLIGDISSYSDIIDRILLKEKIKKIGLDNRVNELLFLYVDVPALKNGISSLPEKGIVTGLPVSVFFNNLYLDNFDKYFGKISSLYRRVGDDFIVYDSNQQLESIAQEMQLFLAKNSIEKKYQKIHFQEKNKSFVFLGHDFNDQAISIPTYSLVAIKEYIRNTFRYVSHRNIDTKKEILIKKISFYKESVENYIAVLVKQYQYINNYQQYVEIDNYIKTRLTIYFFGTYSQKNYFKMLLLIKDIYLPSAYCFNISFHNGLTELQQLKKHHYEQFTKKSNTTSPQKNAYSKQY